MRALTFQQPYATAALTVKPIDNRKRPPPQALVGQRIAIHAGQKFDAKDQWGLHAKVRHYFGVYKANTGTELLFETLPMSAIIGTAKLLGYAIRHESGDPPGWEPFNLTDNQLHDAITSTWRAPGARVLLVLTDAAILPTPIPMKGALGWWRVPEQHLAALEALHA